MKALDTSILDNIIIGRVDPHIYAFETGTIPNYLKVGDTYRPVGVRMHEWRRYFSNLSLVYSESARIDKDTVFRDYSVHKYLELVKQRQRLRPEDLSQGIYYSNEFFKETRREDVVEAIEDIRHSAELKDGRYHFYDNQRLPITAEIERNKSYKLRPNQQQAIDNFIKAVGKGRTNLLMYAVMRFGKSYTALCCAKEKVFGERGRETQARFVLIVSGKGDVKQEWRQNVEGIVGFENFVFMDKDTLQTDRHAITNVIGKGKTAILFLTLQDLQGDKIKEQHREVFQNKVDLLVIDETHYGARAEEYGKVLQTARLKTSQIHKELEGYDETIDNLGEQIKAIDAQVRLHLSGTPYRILMGDEFEKEDIIAFCQFADIVDEQRKWDEQHFEEQERNTSNHTETKEWDNPYFGFPQMVRFAFHLSKTAKAKLEELRKSGVSYAFSELFRPLSLEKKRDGSHKTFKHEKEILEIFQAIDGTKEDANILGFLDYDKINEGQMCRHIVCALPFRTSCDALEALLKKYGHSFKHIGEYEILNIAGYETPYTDIVDFKAAITKCENENRKTIALTVNKFLTGSTVEQWDTMLYFKDTSSPQEYDQAVFRLQNQYVKTLRQGDEEIRFNMKPQTLLVDFDPDRMFYLQEQKSLFYNTNVNQRGNDDLRMRIEKELRISPIIVINKGKMERITPTNIIDAVRNYQRDKSILDEAIDIPFDKSLLGIEEIKNVVSRLKAIDDKKGLELSPSEGDDTDIEIPTSGNPNTSDEEDETQEHSDTDDEEEKLRKKLAAYYVKILFYAFLTHDKVSTLKQIIETLDKNDNNKRIAANVGIGKHILQLIFDNADPFKLSYLDGKIENVNTQGRDESMSPIDRATVAMKKFSRISDSEVVTPKNVAEDMVSYFVGKDIRKGCIVLDIASKQGELAYAFVQKHPHIENLRLYSVTTSKLTYELTRKVYEALGLPVEDILGFYSFDLLGDNRETLMEKLKSLRPNIVLLAPPYNKLEKGGRKDSGNGSAIYHFFYDIALSLCPDHIVMYTKSNWYSGGRGEGLAHFRKEILEDERIACLNDYPDPKTYIDSKVNLRGGVCHFLWTNGHKGECMVVNHINNETYSEVRPLKYKDVDILIRFNIGIKVLQRVETVMAERGEVFLGRDVYARNPFGLPSNTPWLSTINGKGKHRVYLPKGKRKYIKEDMIPDYQKMNGDINSWKVIVSKASPGYDTLPHSVISTPIVSEPGSLCTDSHLLVRKVENERQAHNLAAYMNTRFFRFMMILAKSNQNMNRETFRFVPLVDLDKEWTDEMLYRHYHISEFKDYIEKLVNAPRV